MKIGKLKIYNPIEVLNKISAYNFIQGYTLVLSLCILVVFLLGILIYTVGLWVIIVLPIIRILFSIFKGK